MKKLLLLFFILQICCFLYSNSVSAQSNRKDFDSTAMSIVSIVMTKSDNIILPEKLIVELKVFAAQNNFPQNYVLKNSIFLKMLYNNNLTFNERKVYLDWAVYNYTYENKYLPVKYFKEALAALKQ